MSRVRRTVTLITLAAYVLLCTVGAGWVLCSGSDGHVAVEALAAGCCGETETPSPCDDPDGDHEGHDHDGDHDGGRDDDCGDCDDVALVDLATARKAQRDTLDPPPAAAVTVVLDRRSFPFAEQPTPAMPRGPPRPPPQREHLTTVILRL